MVYLKKNMDNFDYLRIIGAGCVLHPSPPPTQVTLSPSYPALNPFISIPNMPY